MAKLSGPLSLEPGPWRVSEVGFCERCAAGVLFFQSIPLEPRVCALLA